MDMLVAPWQTACRAQDEGPMGLSNAAQVSDLSNLPG